MRVIVCGGREFQDCDRLISALDSFNRKHGITLLIEGGAQGADTHAGNWAMNNEIPRCTMHANWERQGRKAGPIRNQNMVELLSPDAVIAFPGGRGTKGMIEIARKSGIKVWEVQP